MFEPEELMARIADLESQLKVSEMAPPYAEQLIACLEGEIAKRDARIVELERYQFAFNEWHDKTEWVQAESATLSAKYLGCHRADVMRSLIDGLRAALAAVNAQGELIDELSMMAQMLVERDPADELSLLLFRAVGALRMAAAPASAAQMPACNGADCGCTDGRSHSPECEAEHAAAIAGGAFVQQPTDATLDAAPVSEAKAQGVVMLADTRHNRVYLAGPMTGIEDYNFPAFNAEAARLRATGLHVENPAEHGIVDGADWADYLRCDIGRLATCEKIHLLPGWSQSKGVKLELQIAQSLGMGICYAEGAEEVARLNAAPVQQVSVPDGLELIKRMQVCLSLDDTEWGLSAPEKYKLLGDIKSYVLAAPAAPAADAGVTIHD